MLDREDNYLVRGSFGDKRLIKGAGDAPDPNEVLARYVPPHSIEAEQSVLGALLIDQNAVEKVQEMLSAEDFYRDGHALLFESILALSARSEPIDPITIQEELKKRGRLDLIGGQAYLMALLDAVPTAANVEFYAKIVQDKAVLRRLIDASLEVVGMARGTEVEDVSELVDTAERLIFGVAQRRTNQFFSPLPPLLLSVYERAEVLNELKERISGLATGISDFDMMTAGLQNSDMVIVAARPSMGKTSLCLSIAQHVALREGKTCAIFSLEMSKEQLAMRMLCSEAQVSSHRVRTGHLNEDEWDSLARVVQGMYEAPIYIDDNTEATVLTMRAKCRRLQAEQGLGLIIVDYLQLMRSHRKIENRVQEIGDIARGLKSLARELNVPVIALSQLSRAVEHRENKRPMLSDLRECVSGDTRLINAETGDQTPIRELHSGSWVLGVDGRQKIRAFEVEDVWSTGVKPTWKLTTRTGRNVTATANHPFLTASGWKRLEDLAPGDIIATALRLPEHGEERPGRTDLCRLLGYLTGDGTYQKHRAIGFCGSDPDVVADAIRIVTSCFHGVTWRQKKAYATYSEGEFARVYENGHGKPFGNPLREWLKEVGVEGSKDSTKYVPAWVFEAGNVGAREFLAGYLATDGCVKKDRKRWTIHFDTVSRRLAEDVQQLLLRLGIIATISDGYRSKKATRNIYRIQVLSIAENLRRFFEQITPLGRKGDLLTEAKAMLPNELTNGSLLGLPPEVSDLLYQKTLHLRQQGRKLAAGKRLYWKPQGKRPRRDSCALFAELLKDEALNVWVQSDLLWEEIKRIDPAEEQETFDIRIPGCENFLANGIVAHNSGSIEAEADLVCFLYRESYYKMKEAIASGEKFERPDTELIEETEIIIGKHRNGPTGMVKIGFMPDYAKFVNLERNLDDGSTGF